MAACPTNGGKAARVYQCSKCNKSYNRSSHLRRHEVTHSGEKTSRCCFCNRSFAKVEVARRHAKACAGKSNAPPPPQAKRGRKVRACDRCSQYKVSCDARDPCSRCDSQSKRCTYERRAGNIAASDLAHSKAPFLLSFTAPSNETTIPSFFLDGSWNTNEDSASSHRLLLGSPEDALTGFHPSALDAAVLSNYYDQGFGLNTTGENYNNGLFEDTIVTTDTTVSWELRTDEVLHNLWTTYNEMFRSVGEGCPVFDMGFARTVFSTSNIKQLVWSYFHNFQDELPILHRASFHVDMASPELLLAIIIAGAAFSAPLDYALSARRFLPIADEFIFTQLSRRSHFTQPGTSDPRPEDIQNLQAALIIVIIQGGFNDVQIRRRVKARRHPQVASTVRFFGLLSSRRRALGTWQEFIEDETRVRLAIFVFMADNHYCMFFNQPPQISVSEMVGDLPCSEELWEARDAAQFEHLSAVELQHVLPPPPQSLWYLVNTLMHGPWKNDNDDDDWVRLCKTASHFNLYIAIGALQSVTYTARTSCLGPASFQAILRATDRWREIWGAGPTELASGADNQRKHAFLRHAGETCWLVRTVVKVAQSGDLSSGYMQNLSTDDFSNLHEFIKRYGYL